MALRDWSTSAGSNSTVGLINWAEGQPPSSVNDSARQMMADVADYVNNPGPEWYAFDSATYASGTTFTVPGNQTARYTEGRRVRAKVLGGTFLGTILSSTFSTNTTSTVVWDSGSLDSGLSDLRLGLAQNDTQMTHINKVVSISSTAQPLLYLKTSNGSGGMWIANSTGQKFVGTVGNTLYVANSANTVTIMSLTDAGLLTAANDIQAFSDERLKSDWQDLPADFVEALAGIHRSGTYMRDGERHVGVGAQSLQEILPEAVRLNHEGDTLTVAYGNAALAACVALARRVVDLEKRLQDLEGDQS